MCYLQVVKVAPSSMMCKRLWEKTNHPKMGDIRAVALAAFGTTDAKHVGPKAEHMQRVYNHADSLQSYMGLPADTASVLEESMAEESEDADEDIVFVHCLNGDASNGNDILISEGAHSATVGWHRLCLTPPLQEIPTGCWLCPECVSAQVGLGSCLADPNYAPSTAASSSSSSSSSVSASTSDTTSDSSSDSNSSSSPDFDSDSDCYTVTDFDCDSASDSECD